MSDTPEATKEALLNPVLDLPPDPMQLNFDALFQNEALEAAEVAAEEAEAPVEEAVEAAPVEEAPDEEDFTSRRALAAIARREDAIRRREEELKAQEARTSKLAKLAELIEKGDRLGALEELGVSYDDLTNDYVAGMGRSQEELARQQMLELHKQTQAQIQELREAQARREAEAEQARLRSELESQGETYALVNGLGGHNLVAQTIQSHYRDTGEVLSYEDAAGVVEGALGDLAKRIFSVESVRKRFLGEAGATKSGTVEPATRVATLSNADTQDSTVLVDDGFDPTTASDDEMIERLANQLKFHS